MAGVLGGGREQKQEATASWLSWRWRLPGGGERQGLAEHSGAQDQSSRAERGGLGSKMDLPGGLWEQVARRDAHRSEDSVLLSFYGCFLPPTDASTSGLSVAIGNMGLKTTLHYSAPGELGPASICLTSSSLCGFYSEMTSGLSSAQQRPDDLGNREGKSSSQNHRPRGQVSAMSTSWRRCSSICKMGTAHRAHAGT